jgi:SAM-dependent methyltransferase
MDSNHTLRAIFGDDAELYDRVRPGYPDRLFADLPIGPGSRVLEIGCGTGKATVPLARFGCEVTGVELSEPMAAVARRNLARFPNATVEVAAFEDWAPPAERFDLVLSATAFHWLDPAVRVAKAFDLLRPGGALAVVSTHHVSGGTVRFFGDAQRCYERFDPATPPGLKLEPSSAIPDDASEFGRFDAVRFLRYEWEQEYTTTGYLDLLMSYSGHRALPSPARAGLFGCIGGLIDTDHGGRVTKRYLTHVTLAERRRFDLP